MVNKTAQFFEEWTTAQRQLKKEAPHIVQAFGSLFQSLMKEGALTVREKELVALGIGLSARCAPCMNLHVEKCLAAGATREEILEVAGVTVVMGGGPAWTHIPDLIAALDHLEHM